MTAPDAPACYDVTRIALIDALASLPTGMNLTLRARGEWADVILAQMPEAPGAITGGGDGLYRAVNDAIATAVTAERRRALLAFAADLDAVEFRASAALAREAAEADGAPL